jgi:hypothetical protein
MNKSTFESKFFLYALLIVVILILSSLFNVGDVSAMTSGIDMRADACRTFHVFNHQKSEDTRQEIDGLFCGMSEGTNESKDNDNPVTVTVITIPELPIDSSVPTIPDETIIPDESTDSEDSTVITDEDTTVITDEDTTVITEEQEENADNGNHYGNNKPDNNENDVNNIHNGEESKDDHHNNNGNH